MTKRQSKNTDHNVKRPPIRLSTVRGNSDTLPYHKATTTKATLVLRFIRLWYVVTELTKNDIYTRGKFF